MSDHKQVQVRYDNRITAYFLYASLLWGLLALFLSSYTALELLVPKIDAGFGFLSYGRLWPLQNHLLVFGFAANGFFAGLFYSLPRLCKQELWSSLLARIHFFLWQGLQLACLLTLALGYSQGKELAESEWPLDMAFIVIWGLLLLQIFQTLAHRRRQFLNISIWFYLASLIAVPLVFIVPNIVVPISFLQSLGLTAGIQDAFLQGWYTKNLRVFLLLMPFIGLMYYFVPKAVARPIRSVRWVQVQFWTLVAMSVWAGPEQHLLSALPEWLQSLGMLATILQFAPCVGVFTLGLGLLRSSRWRREPALQFFLLALFCFAVGTLIEPLLAFKTVRGYLNYTDWAMAEKTALLQGWVGAFIYGMAYALVFGLWRRPLYSRTLAYIHCALYALGLFVLMLSYFGAGLLQAWFWFSSGEDGLLNYVSFADTALFLKPFYQARWAAQVFLFLSSVLGTYTLYRSIREHSLLDDQQSCVADAPIVMQSWARRWEVHVGILSSFILILGFGGTLFEYIPLSWRASTLANSNAVHPYSPLALLGRELYRREGCVSCHSQMVQGLLKDEQRYGFATQAYEIIYDRPVFWGAHRLGPDLQRLGKKFPALWHYQHLLNPQSLRPTSVMPAYRRLAIDELDTRSLGAKLQRLSRLGVPYEDKLQ
ncbi:MAG: cbb3-type cytochrome c oxidase subunit I, partial [Proteobacteria bacterium]|nr:cbb3-type cytochrome c oxidase subunit I [Pseudomonadota bacterium]